MSTRLLRIIALLAIISILGIATVQVFWFGKAFDLREKEFTQTVNVALQTVGEYILTVNKQNIPLEPLVQQLSGDYFIVQINGEINPRTLEFLLKTEFQKRNLEMDFEYGVYNCETKKMVYGNYVSLDKNPDNDPITRGLPTWRKDNYYFGVLFPKRDSTMIQEMGIWLFSSIVMLLVCVFFIFTLFFIFRQKQLSEIQKDFINNITHEFKTPLSTIVISTELLKNQQIYQFPEQIAKYTTIIQNEVNRLKGQVESVLQVAAFDKEKVQFKFEEIDLHECIRAAAEGIELMVHQKQGTIHWELAAENPLIYADKLHITNVIYNFLENAVKYTLLPPEITLKTESDNKGISMTVQDNGIGISPIHQRKIFDRFYRVPTGNIHNVKGFGLGLYYAKLVVEAHKGKISVQSKEGEGSVFRVFLARKN